MKSDLILIRVFGVALFTGVASMLGACASGSSGTSGMGKEVEENAIVHTVTPEDRAFAESKQAIAADTAVLWVNGLGCPQCASNIDLQLERVRGVKSVNVDLSNGKVTVGLGGTDRPSPSRLGHAVADAGFTLVKIEIH